MLCFRGEAAASNPPSLRDGERGAGPERAQRFAGGAAFLVSSCEMGSELRDSRAVLVAKARGPVTAP